MQSSDWLGAAARPKSLDVLHLSCSSVDMFLAFIYREGCRSLDLCKLAGRHLRRVGVEATSCPRPPTGRQMVDTSLLPPVFLPQGPGIPC